MHQQWTAVPLACDGREVMDIKQNRIMDIFIISGCLLITVGAGILHISAGLIIAGIFILAAAVLLMKGGDEK